MHVPQVSNCGSAWTNWTKLHSTTIHTTCIQPSLILLRPTNRTSNPLVSCGAFPSAMRQFWAAFFGLMRVSPRFSTIGLSTTGYRRVWWESNHKNGRILDGGSSSRFTQKIAIRENTSVTLTTQNRDNNSPFTTGYHTTALIPHTAVLSLLFAKEERIATYSAAFSKESGKRDYFRGTLNNSIENATVCGLSCAAEHGCWSSLASARCHCHASASQRCGLRTRVVTGQCIPPSFNRMKLDWNREISMTAGDYFEYHGWDYSSFQGQKSACVGYVVCCLQAQIKITSWPTSAVNKSVI